MTSTDWAIGWVEDNCGITLDDGQRRAVATLAGVWQIYNTPTLYSFGKSSRFDYADQMTVLLSTTLSTFDGSDLTRLVRAAHLNRVRVSISAYVPRRDDAWDCAFVEQAAADYNEEFGTDMEAWDSEYDTPLFGIGLLKVQLHARSDDRSNNWEYHPSVEELIDNWQSQN